MVHDQSMMLNNLNLNQVFVHGNLGVMSDDGPLFRQGTVDLDELCPAEQAVLTRLLIPLGSPRVLELSGHAVVSERRLRALAEGTFDLVLCGRHCLDGLHGEARIRSLAQIHRVLTPGGWLCFDAANLRGLLWQTLRRIRQRPLLAWCQETFQLLQQDVLSQRSRPHLVVQEGPRGGVYYIQPEEQVAQLEDAGFEWIDIYDEEILIPGAAQAALRELRASRLHYLCRKPIP